MNDSYDFNAVLIYYSVYNKSADILLATNLLGILFLDPPSGNTQDYPASEISFPSITKLQSGPSGFGTSYSFRLNIKSDYMLDDTRAEIVDESTSSQLELTNWNEVFDSLGKTLSVLNQQTGTLSYVTEQYLNISANQTNILNEIDELTNKVNNLSKEVDGTEDAIGMFSSGSRPLVESSLYMRNGKIGAFTSRPIWPFQIDASLKTTDIYLEKSIRDISGNMILGYGSPIQLGSSTNYREITMYTGSNDYAFKIDTSNNISFGSLINSSTAYTTYYDPNTKRLSYGPAPSLKFNGWDIKTDAYGNIMFMYNNNVYMKMGHGNIVTKYAIAVDSNLSVNTILTEPEES